MYGYIVNTLIFIRTIFAKSNPSLLRLIVATLCLIWSIPAFIHVNELERIEMCVSRLSIHHKDMHPRIDVNFSISINRGLMFSSDSVGRLLRCDLNIAENNVINNKSQSKDYLKSIYWKKMHDIVDDSTLFDHANLVGYVDCEMVIPTRRRSQEQSDIYKIYRDSTYYVMSVDDTYDSKNNVVQSKITNALITSKNIVFDKFRYTSLSDFSWTGSHSEYPNIMHPWDVSQSVYKFKFPVLTIGYNIKRVSLNFMGPVSFSQMMPTPDVITMSGVEFNDPEKIQQLRMKGVEMLVHFEQLKNIQSMRIFILTSLITLCVTVIIKQIYNLLACKLNAVVAHYKSEMID